MILKDSKQRNVPGAIICTVSAAIAALAGFLPWLIRDQGFFTLAYDYNFQQIPFAAAAYEGIKQLSAGEWVWNLDLGSALMTGFGFYNLGSPFFWVTLFFSKESFPYLAGILYVLKYVTAAMLTYFWLKQSVKNEQTAVLGGLLYAFSGFQATNLLFYHFHEIVAFFPLLLLGTDRLVRERKGSLFSFAVFLNCLVNYTFFVQEAIFLAMYFLFRYFRKDRIGASLEFAMKMFLGALLGVAMAAVLFLPNVIYVLNNARGVGHFDLSGILYDAKGILFILKGFLFPGEAMSEESAIYQYQYGSTSLYLPFFGMSFVLIYLLKNKGWLRRMLILLVLISFSPLIQSGFLLFTESNQRWWYMLSLLCVLATCQVLEKEQYKIRGAGRLMLIYCGCVTIYCLLLGLLRGPSGGSLVQKKELFLLFGGMAVLFSAVCFAMVRYGWLNLHSAMVVAVIACAVTTGAAIGAYKRGDEHDAVKQDYQVGLRLEKIDDQYRYDTSHNLFIMPGRGAGVGAFSSTAENSAYAFRSKVYDFDANFTYQSIALQGLSELMGGRYEIVVQPKDEKLIDSFEVGGFRYGIAEKEACPIGFATGNYITLDELHRYPEDERSYVLMDAVAVESSEKVKKYHERLYSGEDGLNHPETLIRRAEENKVLNFIRDSHGFRCSTEYKEDQLVFFSVPNDSGWSAFIDEKETDILDSCGLMAISVPSGSHRIEFVYNTPGTRPGTVISLAGWMVFCLSGIVERRRHHLLATETRSEDQQLNIEESECAY